MGRRWGTEPFKVSAKQGRNRQGVASRRIVGTHGREPGVAILGQFGGRTAGRGGRRGAEAGKLAPPAKPGSVPMLSTPGTSGGRIVLHTYIHTYKAGGDCVMPYGVVLHSGAVLLLSGEARFTF